MSRFKDELDYLIQSLTFVQERGKTVLENLREAKRDCETLKEDCTKITTKRLLDTATQTHNHFNAEQVRLREILKEIREDEKWIKRILRIVQDYYKKKG